MKCLFVLSNVARITKMQLRLYMIDELVSMIKTPNPGIIMIIHAPITAANMGASRDHDQSQQTVNTRLAALRQRACDIWKA